MSNTYKLSDIYELQMGKTPSRDNDAYWKNGQYEWVSIADLSKGERYVKQTKEKITEIAIEESGIKVIPSDTVIMSFKLSIGKVAITQSPVYSNEAIMAFIDKGVIPILPQYAYYLFSAQKWDKGTNRAVMGATLNKATLSQYRVYIHNTDVQREIIEKLNKIVDLISLRREQIQKIDELVKSQFIEMFGQIGKDEKGWGLVALGECCELNPKKSSDSRLQAGLEVSFVPMPAVGENGEFDSSDKKLYEQVQTGFTYFAENDVLFAKITPCMENGKGAVARRLYNGIGFGSTEFHVMRPTAGVSIPEWLYAVTTFKEFRQDAAKKMTGSAGQRRVPSAFLASYRVSLPPMELQNEFARFVEQTDKSKFRIKQSLEKLEICYKALLQKYFG